MATVIVTQDPHAGFNATMFGAPARELVDFMGEAYDRASQYLNQTAHKWHETLGEVFHRVDYDKLVEKTRRFGKEVARTVGFMDIIKPLYSTEEIQDAPHVMRRYLMAEPTARALYHQGGCEGYEGYYIDYYPEAIGEVHYDYRRVMDGVVVVDEGGGWYADSYLENLRGKDVDLSDDERMDILQSWGVLKRSIEAGDRDPTSLYNGSLK